MPFFSIVIPTYNRGHFLNRSLRTLSRQRFTDYEIIIVDDGSTDNTTEVIKQNQLLDGRIKYIYQQNSERAAARNNGFRASTSEYVVFFDSDDLMHENHLSTLYDGIIKYGYPNFVATKYSFIRGTKIVPSDMAPLKEGFYNYQLFLNGNPLACNVCVKRNNPNIFLFEEDKKFAIKEDWLFLLQNLKRDSLLIIDKTTLWMIDHEERSMRIDHLTIISKTLLTFDWIKRNVDLSENEFHKVISHAYYFCSIHAYIANKRRQAMVYLIKATFSIKGISAKHIFLFFKIMIGRKNFAKLNLTSQ